MDAAHPFCTQWVLLTCVIIALLIRWPYGKVLTSKDPTYNTIRFRPYYMPYRFVSYKFILFTSINCKHVYRLSNRSQSLNPLHGLLSLRTFLANFNGHRKTSFKCPLLLLRFNTRENILVAIFYTAFQLETPRLNRNT